MKLAGPLILAALASLTAQASDFAGVYGIVDKVGFEPSADRPQRVQIFGVFTVAGNSNGSEYLSPQRGYLYFTLDGLPDKSKEKAVNEWKDVASVAGTRMPIAFAGRFVGPNFPPIRVRKTDEKPADPERYRFGIGATKMRSDSAYAHVKALLEFH